MPGFVRVRKGAHGGLFPLASPFRAFEGQGAGPWPCYGHSYSVNLGGCEGASNPVLNG